MSQKISIHIYSFIWIPTDRTGSIEYIMLYTVLWQSYGVEGLLGKLRRECSKLK